MKCQHPYVVYERPMTEWDKIQGNAPLYKHHHVLCQSHIASCNLGSYAFLLHCPLHKGIPVLVLGGLESICIQHLLGVCLAGQICQLFYQRTNSRLLGIAHKFLIFFALFVSVVWCNRHWLRARFAPLAVPNAPYYLTKMGWGEFAPHLGLRSGCFHKVKEYTMGHNSVKEPHQWRWCVQSTR